MCKISTKYGILCILINIMNKAYFDKVFMLMPSVLGKILSR